MWQWSIELAGVTSPETGGAPRAFLWIPPDCAVVRGVVVGQHNLEEEPILEHAVLRRALQELGFAAVWISPPLDLAFQFDQGSGSRFEAMLTRLAQESGYSELEFVPVLPIGHSAAASYPWNYAIWNPRRTLACISVSGQWPFGDGSMPVDPTDAPLDGIPGLVTLGEYEWANERAAVGVRQRVTRPQLPLTLLAEAGGGHFDASEAKVAYLALYIRKAAAARLPSETAPPATAPVPLQSVDPTMSGWLVDRWRGDEPARVPAAPVAEYAEPDEAFWCFDEEHAVATEKFRLADRGKRVALIGYVQQGAVLPQAPDTHQQVTIPFQPEADGITFQLGATFLATVPPGRPERWTGLKAGARIGHPADPETITIDRICGPVGKRSADIFFLQFRGLDLWNVRRGVEIWLAATHPGDAHYKRAVQQALLRIPRRNETGRPQRLTFGVIADQPAAARRIKLTASSDAGLPVRFLVREGPAEVDGDTLVVAALPPRTRFPVRVTVVAWQYGRASTPPVQTAEPVERTFFLRR